MSWITSSYSGYNGNCVQVAFKTASYSVNNGACVEAGEGACGMVHVRDSKDKDGGVLSFSRADWMEFLAGLKLPL